MEIKNIAIVGASSLGRRIAYTALLAGYRTVLEDISLSVLEDGIASVLHALGEAVGRGTIPASVRDAAVANLSASISAEDASREADLIIEAVADEMEMKIELFTIFDKFAKPGAIFASTTASLSISEMAAVTFCPERCIGMRFFVANAKNISCLELVKGNETSEETVAACGEVGRRMGMGVSVLRDDRATSASAGR
jgi:3-hydroxybutyryl-CoA dehydrogenase